MTQGADKQLPFLLQLLDDPSPIVRREVKQALMSYGYFLRPSTADKVKYLPQEARQQWESICELAEEKAIENTWLAWMLYDDPAKRLEAAMLSLEYKGGFSQVYIRQLLDGLASGFLEAYSQPTTPDLMEYLFRQKGFGQTLREESYLQHRLGYTLRYERGSDLGLSILAKVVASRAGLNLEMIQVQNRWLIWDRQEGRNDLYNPCLNGALIVRGPSMILEETYRRDLLHPSQMAHTTEGIVMELLERHVEGYEKSGQTERLNEMQGKLDALRQEMDRRNLVQFLVE